MLKVGFIGLGLMGNPMAKNILKKGIALTVYNRTKVKTKELQKLGASVANSPKELAKNSDVIITMVTSGKDVREVLFGKNGVVFGAKKGSIVIDMSTIGPTSVLQIGKKLEKYAIEFLDAPVTGSTPKAITGELTIFIGGKEKVYKKVQSILSAMGTNLQYIGKLGLGQAIKLINNHLIAATTIALAEGMMLSDLMNLQRKKTAEVLKTVPAMSGFMNLKVDNFINDTYPLLFSTANMSKDLALAVLELEKSLLGKTGKRKLPILQIAEKLYREAVSQNLGSMDMSAVAKLIGKS